MKVCAKIIMSLTLICYIAVSSVAVAHVFQTTYNLDRHSPTVVGNNDKAHSETSPNCHQQLNSNEAANAISACEIFCAVTGNVIIDDVAVTLHSNKVGTEIIFLLKSVAQISRAVEPHPPK